MMMFRLQALFKNSDVLVQPGPVTGKNGHTQYINICYRVGFGSCPIEDP